MINVDMSPSRTHELLKKKETNKKKKGQGGRVFKDTLFLIWRSLRIFKCKFHSLNPSYSMPKMHVIMVMLGFQSAMYTINSNAFAGCEE